MLTGHTAGSGEDQVTFIGNPFACQKLLEQRLVEAAPGAVVDIFGAGANMAQAGRAHAALKPFGLAAGGLLRTAVQNSSVNAGLKLLHSPENNLHHVQGHYRVKRPIFAICTSSTLQPELLGHLGSTTMLGAKP